ncbi:MAG: M28 family peptidase [Planctomycetes bacterium]|nr:M28 family peptidase [Planctomycetota bacterium]
MLPAQAPGADGAVDQDAVAFFLEEGLERSEVMEHLSWLCDVYGPRVTGSPNLRKAQQWSARRFRKMGMSPTLEEWGPFGRGWRCEHVSMAVVGDNPWPVIAYAKAWSPGLDGRVEADVVHVASMTAEELRAADLDGKVVLLAPMRPVSEPFDGVSQRHDSESLLRLADQQRAEVQRSGDRARAARSSNDFRMGFRKRMQMLAIVQQKQPLLIVDCGSKGEYGTVFTTGASANNPPNTPRAERKSARDQDAVVIPQMTIAVEHYNRMCRVLAKGLPVRVAVELTATFFDGEENDYNVVADLPGGDLAEQFAMIGAHLDSWQSGTGATDNGAGSAVVIEAARLVSAYCKHKGIQPRRTIRACLWSGEEQGLLGSRAYVRSHLGSRDEPKPEAGKVSGYFNLDNGTGRIRGVYLQGNDEVARVFRPWLRPFHEHAASTLTLDNTGGTDHLAFHGVGVPGFQFIQDPISYSTRTHHSNMDNWDHAVADDLKQASVIMATFVWQTAQRDEMLPRIAGGAR